jgi:hypothetical protein
MKIKYIGKYPYILKRGNLKQIIFEGQELDLPEDLAKYLVNLPKRFFAVEDVQSGTSIEDEWFIAKEIFKDKLKIDIDKLIKEYKLKNK